jgi:LuxR family transcriptional regulator, activator of conjugal transfer of Ti plasmids
LDSRIEALIDAIDVASSEHMIGNALKNYAIACGFERFAYMQAYATEMKTFNNYPSEWGGIYFRHRYSKIDPVVTTAKRGRQMFNWSSDEWIKSGTSKEVRKFCSQAMSFGIRAGTTIPVEGSYGAVILLTFATSRSRFDAAVLGDALSAQRAALAVHYRLRDLADLPKTEPALCLSSKEAICLKWSEHGRTMQEIADLTKIQYRTVQHYLDNARRKLGARNVTQAVAIAKDHDLL